MFTINWLISITGFMFSWIPVTVEYCSRWIAGEVYHMFYVNRKYNTQKKLVPLCDKCNKCKSDSCIECAVQICSFNKVTLRTEMYVIHKIMLRSIQKLWLLRDEQAYIKIKMFNFFIEKRSKRIQFKFLVVLSELL